MKHIQEEDSKQPLLGIRNEDVLSNISKRTRIVNQNPLNRINDIKAINMPPLRGIISSL
jgi:hypothetical protein